jgi:hypothetical protein
MWVPDARRLQDRAVEEKFRKAWQRQLGIILHMQKFSPPLSDRCESMI